MKEETFFIVHHTKAFGPINLYYRKRQYLSGLTQGLSLVYGVSTVHHLGRESVMMMVDAAIKNPHLYGVGKVVCAFIENIDGYTPILRIHSVNEDDVESFYTNDDKSIYPFVDVKELSRYWDAPNPTY